MSLQLVTVIRGEIVRPRGRTRAKLCVSVNINFILRRGVQIWKEMGSKRGGGRGWGETDEREKEKKATATGIYRRSRKYHPISYLE